MHYTYLQSHIGNVLVVGDETGLRFTSFSTGKRQRLPETDWKRDCGALRYATAQLEEYLAGERTRFDLEIAPHGTPFQLSVWRALQEIPYGETRAYGELARHIGRPGASRAVGAASGSNPLPIVIPCHRLVGSSGDLTGFGGGIETKRTLLALERRAPRPPGALELDVSRRSSAAG